MTQTTNNTKRLAVHNPDGSWSLPQVKRAEGLHPTDIGWCDFSANVIRAIDTQTGKIGWHCDHQSPACANCYAESINKFVGTGLEYRREHFESGRVRIELDMQRINAILNYRLPEGFKGVAGDGRPKIFWNDMTDTFGEFVPDHTIYTMLAVAAIRRDLDHLLLTKRTERMARLLSDPGTMSSVAQAMWQLGYGDDSMSLIWPLPNVWAGTTVENQKQADIRVPLLSRCNAAVRFLSIEPLLGEIDLTEAGAIYPGACGCQEEAARTPCEACSDTGAVSAVDWAILGCESAGKRTNRFADGYLDAATSIIKQCDDAGVAVYHKQWPIDGKIGKDITLLHENLRRREWPKARAV